MIHGGDPWTNPEPIKGPLRGPEPARPAPAATPTRLQPAAVKTTSDYFQALRRRFWMVLAIAVPLADPSVDLVLKLPPVYMAKAEIEINPPGIDPELSALVTHDPGRRDPSVGELRGQPEVLLRSKARREGRQTTRHSPQAAQYARPCRRALQDS